MRDEVTRGETFASDSRLRAPQVKVRFCGHKEKTKVKKMTTSPLFYETRRPRAALTIDRPTERKTQKSRFGSARPKVARAPKPSSGVESTRRWRGGREGAPLSSE